MENENLRVLPITFNIYAKDDDEAKKGRAAIIRFIDIMGQHGARVSGEKIAEAVLQLNSNPFIASQIIRFFTKQD